MIDDVRAAFKEFENIDRFVGFHRKDLTAFMRLDNIVPSDKDMVACAEHDQILLGVDLETFAERATMDDVKYLSQCGVWYDEDTDSLSMYV